MTAPRLQRAWIPRIAAGALLLLGCIPFAAFVPVGLEIPGLATQLRDWTTGTLLTVGVGALSMMWARHRGGSSPRHSVPLGIWVADYLVPFCSLLLYATIATVVFSRRPLLIDELAQLWQAQRYADGKLWIPTAPHREFFSFLHLVDLGPRTYAQFPPGGPFMLWLGVLAGAPWLVGPVCGALIVGLFARLARALEPTASVTWVAGATLLFAVTPFAAFMFGSYMNHVTALLFLMVASLAIVRLTETADRTRWGAAAALGLGLGAAATIRPLDAFAFALPAALWLLARAGRDVRRWRENVVAGVGVALPFAAMMYVNLQTTGHPLRFGYEVLWGASHGLGFHAAPWGTPHTPLRGFVLAALYQWRLQSYLFETPFPSLLLPILALALWRAPLRAADRFLLAASGLTILFYLLYWHDGFYLGPRFVVPLLPALVLWTARIAVVVRDRVIDGPWRAGIRGMFAFGVVGAVVFALPVRVASYRAGLTSMREDYGAIADAAGVRNALVFVRESWGAQLVARLWAAGISRPKSETIYRGVDACHIELTLEAIERDGLRGAAAESRFADLLAADSAHVVKSTLTPDPTERLLPGSNYAPICLQRIAEDRQGFLHYAPLRLVTLGGNVYARDLHARDSLLLAQYPDRPAYLMRRDGVRVDAPIVFERLR